MFKRIFVVLCILCSYAVAMAQPAKAPISFYDLKAVTIHGKPFHFASLKGKKVMIVNTATRCAYFIKQYADLQGLHEEYSSNNFVVIGFPANDFKQQEPGSNDEIAQYCHLNYYVTFPMMGKSCVKGDSMCNVYQWLTTKALNGVMESDVKWNFQKYMIDEMGKLVGVAYSREKPDSRRIVDWIKTGRLASEY